MRIVIGSRNPKKRAEIESLLEGVPVELVGLEQFPEAPEVVEDQPTLDGNAFKKATELARATGEWVLGEDTGLEVEALQGEPGVRSARYSDATLRSGASLRSTSPGATDERNIKKLLKNLEGVPLEQRRARFRTVLVLAGPEGEIFRTEGTCSGLIALEPRGSNGFGYDPVMFIPRLGRTFAERDPEQKNRSSHRGAALRKFREQLPQWCDGIVE